MVDTAFFDENIRQSFHNYVVSLPALGEGSFKVAYLANDYDDRELVLKILKEPLVEDLEEVGSNDLPDRFARELAGMSQVESPYVVRLLRPPGVCTISQQQFIWYAEPFYSGGTLEDRLQSGAVPADEVAEIVSCLLAAVDAMWTTASIVHRDIKPGNIAFGLDGNPVLLDLGIAYFSDMSTLTDSMASSPRTSRYAAPEQFELRRAASIDFRTDLFLIGIVAAEMILGRHPFWSPEIGFADYWARLNNFDPAWLPAESCPTSLRILISRLLQARPSRRYRTIQSARTALEGRRR